MPQLALWAKSHPVCFVAEYKYDPRDPIGACSVSVRIYNQANTVLAAASTRVVGPHLDEWVADVLQAAWLTYLYGELDEMQHTISAVSKRWREAPALGVTG